MTFYAYKFKLHFINIVHTSFIENKIIGNRIMIDEDAWSGIFENTSSLFMYKKQFHSLTFIFPSLTLMGKNSRCSGE